MNEDILMTYIIKNKFLLHTFFIKRILYIIFILEKREYMKNLEEYTPCELATLATIIGIIIAAKLNINQQNLVGNFLDGVGQTIFIIAAQAQNLQPTVDNQGSDNENSNSSSSNVDLQNQIDELKEHIKKFEDNMNC